MGKTKKKKKKCIGWYEIRGNVCISHAFPLVKYLKKNVIYVKIPQKREFGITLVGSCFP